MRSIRVGVPRKSFLVKIDDILIKDFKYSLRILESVGVTIVDYLNFKGVAEYNILDSLIKRLVVEGSFKIDIETYL